MVDDGSPVADAGQKGTAVLLMLLLLLVAAWIVIGVIGFIVKGLFWLFIIACVAFAITLLIGAFHGGRGSRRVIR